ncbi:tRNA adenosine(34) deaminase TadA [Desulforhopalus vacuolatus]|nr:tRNA adenosine(34) deaminase TadA [Desulforhopalus vacuolatus]
MNLALEEARIAASKGEVPVGAVIVREGELLARAGNSPIGLHDPTAHAEILALRAACRREENYRLPRATLYVTLEPCVMCMGAMLHARVARLVYGATDPKTGAAHSLFQLGGDERLNHYIEITGDVLAEESGEMLREFFRSRRKRVKG